MDEYTFTLSAEEDEELIDELDRAEQGGRLNEHIRNLLRSTMFTSQQPFPLIKNHYNHACLQLMIEYAESDIVDRLIHGTFTSERSIGEQIVIGHLHLHLLVPKINSRVRRGAFWRFPDNDD